jgi:hypothetical protein
VEGLDERSAHVCFYISSLAIEWQYSRIKERENAEQRHHKKSRFSLREMLLFSASRCVSVERFSLSLEESVFSLKCASE